jgi:hypothetical protein
MQHMLSAAIDVLTFILLAFESPAINNLMHSWNTDPRLYHWIDDTVLSLVKPIWGFWVRYVTTATLIFRVHPRRMKETHESFYWCNIFRSLGSWAGIAMSDSWTTGIRFPAGSRFFPSPQCSDRLWGPHSPIKWVLGYLSLGAKQPVHEADHSSPFNAEAKRGGAIPPLPLMSSWCAV